MLMHLFKIAELSFVREEKFEALGAAPSIEVGRVVGTTDKMTTRVIP